MAVSAPLQALAGLVVVDLTHYLPGPLREPGARPAGRAGGAGGAAGRRPAASDRTGWRAELNAGKESVVCNLKADLGFAQALCARADLVLDGFRPGVIERLGLRVPERAVWCSFIGFGPQGRHARRVGHDLNYLHSGTLAAVAAVLAALLERERTGWVDG